MSMLHLKTSNGLRGAQNDAREARGQNAVGRGRAVRRAQRRRPAAIRGLRLFAIATVRDTGGSRRNAKKFMLAACSGISTVPPRILMALSQLDGPAAGNNLLHAAPALRGPAFLESPKLMCALRRLLGPGYRVHPHCRGHLRQRSAKTSMWHVDAYKGLPWCSGRHHEPRWLMLMYYPQETTAEMGPTQLLPGSQYYRGDSDRHHYSRGHIPDFGEQLSGWATSIHTVTGPPGTIVIMHYDLWHRALASASDLPRLMLKFVVSRSSPPPASPRAPPPRWPLVLYSTDDLELLAAEPLLDFLLAGGLEQGDGAAGSRPASAPKRRFDRQLEASSAAAAPSSEAVDVGDVAASDDDAAGLATMLSSFLDANETEGAASHRSDLWSGLDLLNSKGAVEAEQRLFAAAVGLAKEALSTNKQRMPLCYHGSRRDARWP